MCMQAVIEDCGLFNRRISMQGNLCDMVVCTCVRTCRISLEDWRRGDQKILAWTVNSRAEQEDFKKRDVPFFTDSAIREMPEAWIPPQRRMTLSFLAQKRSWTILMLILVPPLFYWGFPVS